MKAGKRHVLVFEIHKVGYGASNYIYNDDLHSLKHLFAVEEGHELRAKADGFSRNLVIDSEFLPLVPTSIKTAQ